MKKNKDFEIEPIFLPSTSLDIELTKDKWFDVEFYRDFKLSCVFTTADNYNLSSSFTNTHYEPLVTFTFHAEEESTRNEDTLNKNDDTDNNKYFCFCSQQTLAIIQYRNDHRNLNPLLQSLTRAFLIPTAPNDSKEFLLNIDKNPSIYPFNLIDHEDSFTELNHFYDYYIERIKFKSNTDVKSNDLNSDKFSLSSFLTISLKPALLFLIRRNYFPLIWFLNQSFSTQAIFSSENCDKTEFKFDDFVRLRDLFLFENSRESLYIHKDTGSLLSIKTYNDAEQFCFEKEVFHTCRSDFIRPCYGFISGDGSENKGSLVLEFMSGGKASDILKDQSLEAILKSRIVTQVILGIDTLNAKGYVVTAFDKDCVYFDCDISAYISDLRFVKLFDDSISTQTFIDQSKKFAQFIKDVGGPDFPQAESGPIVHLYASCMSNTHNENPSIFSMVNSLRKKRLFFSWTMKDIIYDSLKDLFEQQVTTSRKDIEVIHHRAKSTDKKDPEAELIIGLTYFANNIVSPKKALEYLMKNPISEKLQPIAHHLALYLEVLKIPEFFSLITSLASNGHVLSQAYVGIISYRRKYPQLFDMGKAFEWLTVASSHNSAEALFSLGCLYEEGTYVERNINKALKYYMKSADLFFHRANYRIGKLFYHGLGVKQDDEMAFTYLSLASLANIVEANSYLAKILIRKSYIFKLNQLQSNKPNNDSSSLQLLEHNSKIRKMILNLLLPSANLGVVNSQRIIYKFIAKDAGVIDRKIIIFLKRAAINKDKYSIKTFGDLLISDNSIFKKNENEAYKWYQIGSELGEKNCQFKVGLKLIEEGDISNGLLYIRESVRLCNPEAQFYLGTQYLIGRPKGIVNQNIIKGVGLIQMSMYQNYSLAFEKIGEIFIDNNYLLLDYIQAFYYLNFALNYITPKAPLYLGMILEEGLGCKPDYGMAIKMYTKCLRSSPTAIIRYLSMIRDGKGFPNKNPTEAIERMKKIVNSTPHPIPRLNSEYLRYAGDGYLGVELNYKDTFLKTVINNDQQQQANNNTKKNKKNTNNIALINNMLPLSQNSDLVYNAIQIPDVVDDGDMQGLFIQARMIEFGDPQRNINGDPKRAFKLYKKCAIEGNNVNAMYELGRCYEHGDCVKKDLEAAFRWYYTCINESSYENSIDDDDTQYDDYFYYYYDDDENNNYYCFDNENLMNDNRRFRKPLSNCQVEALYKVGAMLYRGIGVKKKNINEAKRFLLRAAAEYKHIDAQAELAYLLYEIGDNKNSIKFCTLASEGGNPFATVLLAQIYHDGLMSDKEGKQISSILQKAEQKGIIDAQFVLGKYYEDDSNDINKAFHWFSKAAKNGFKEAEYKIAQMYLEGLTDNHKDNKKALKWFKRAARVKDKEKKCYSSIHPYYVKVPLIDEKDNNKKINTKNNKHQSNLIVDGSDDDYLDQIYVTDYINNYYQYLYHQDEYFNFNSYLEHNNIQLQHKENVFVDEHTQNITINDKSNNLSRYTDPNFITSSAPYKTSIFLSSSSTSTLSMLNAARIYNHGGTYVEMNKQKASKWFRYAAKYGNSAGMYSYASLLDKDSLPPQFQINQILAEREKDSSLEWFSMAARRGETKAFGKIMHMYACGVHRKKIETPILKLKELIEVKEDVNAMIDLGDIYYYGNSGNSQVREVARAIDLYKRAAEKGNDIAQYKLAVIYEAADKNKAASLFEKSAQNGNLASMVFIADIYNKNKQYGEALKWYERCSRAGLTHAKLVIGRMYAEGQGTAIDKKKAEIYFKEASECGSAEGMFECAKLLVEDSQPNFKKIMSLLFKSADGGCGEAMNMLGLMYREGLGVIPDENRAKVWFTRGSDRSCNQATLNLAKMNYEGFHRNKNGSGEMIKDIPAAIELFTKASKKGSIVAKLYLAKIIKSGEGCTKDEAKAGELYMEAAKMEGMEMTDAGLEDLRLAADCKNPAACNIIAQRIIDGREDRDNDELRLKRFKGKLKEAEEREFKLNLSKKAYGFFLIAAKANISNALYQLGKLFETGKGGSRSKEKAISYYKEAAEEGSEFAMQRLSEIAPDLKYKKYDECPTNKTADRLIRMHCFECLTCNLVNNHVICPKCANNCHKNHSLIDIGTRSSVFCCCTLCKGALKH